MMDRKRHLRRSACEVNSPFRERVQLASQRGAILPLVALSVMVLLAFLAFAIDLARVQMARNRFTEIAEKGCLAALEEYIKAESSEENPDEAENEKRNAAHGRLEALLGINFSESDFARPQGSLVNLLGNMPVGQSTPTEGSNGSIWFGHWETGEQKISEQCGLGLTQCCNGALGCFIPISDSDERVTALRVDLHVDPASIQHWISNIFGANSFGIGVRTSCAVVPRHTMVVVDLSPSTAFDTNRPLDSIEEEIRHNLTTLRNTNSGWFVFDLTHSYDTQSGTDLYFGSGSNFWDDNEVYSYDCGASPNFNYMTPTPAPTPLYTPTPTATATFSVTGVATIFGQEGMFAIEPAVQGIEDIQQELPGPTSAPVTPPRTGVVVYHEHYNPCLPGLEPLSRLPLYNPSICDTGQLDGDYNAIAPLCVAGGACPLIGPTPAGVAETIHHCPSFHGVGASLSYGSLRDYRGNDRSPEDAIFHAKDDYTVWFRAWKEMPNWTLFWGCYSFCLNQHPINAQELPLSGGQIDRGAYQSAWREFMDCVTEKSYACNWGHPPEHPTPPPQPCPPVYPTKPAYRCGACTYRGCTSNGRNHMVDSYVDYNVGADGEYIKPGPQPFSNYMAGVHTLLNVVEERGIPGDKVGLVGVATGWSDNGSMDPLKFFHLSEPGTVLYQIMKDLTDYDATRNEAATVLFDRVSDGPWEPVGPGVFTGLNFSRQWKAMMLHQFFPGSNSSVTNLDVPLRQAQMHFATIPDAPPARQLDIVIASDFLPICKYAGSGGTYNGYYLCSDTHSYFSTAFSELQSYVSDALVGDGIALHAALSGSYVQPHHLLICDHDGKFIDPVRAMKFKIDPSSYVNWTPDTSDTYVNMLDPSSPYRKPNKIFESTQATGGIFQPLRPSCGIDESVVNAKCASGAPFTVITGPETVSFDGQNVTWLDAQGRILCDPYNRSYAEQMRDLMREIMAISAYRIVGPDPLE